jgi:hypothetical protein
MKRRQFIASVSSLTLLPPIGARAAVPAPGTEINAANVNQYLDVLPPSWAQRVQEGEIIRVFETTPANQIIMPKWQELTVKNRGKAKIIDDAGSLVYEDNKPWPGGFPFPDPKSALEIMNNFLYHIEADEWNTVPHMQPMTRLELWRDGKPIKKQVMILTRRRMTALNYIQPKGVEPGFEAELERTASYFLEPYDVRGLAILNITYRDQSKLPDAYAYVPVLRRVRRLPTSQRSDSQGGTDITVGDTQGFGDPLGMWTFKLLGRKKMLASITRAPASVPPGQDIPFVANRFISPYASAELRDTFIVEAIPKYQTLYGKKILYLDADTFRPTVTDFYDKQMKLLKAYHIYWSWDNWPNPRWIFMHNMQTKSLTVAHQFRISPNTGAPLSIWLENSLQQASR